MPSVRLGLFLTGINQQTLNSTVDGDSSSQAACICQAFKPCPCNTRKGTMANTEFLTDNIYLDYLGAGKIMMLIFCLASKLFRIFLAPLFKD
jgi:hypothetical protein